jgi:hypothetical protein
MSKNTNLTGGLFMAKPTPLTQKETSLSARIAEYLDGRGIYNDRLQCGNIETKRGNWVKLCKAGTPDRFCIIGGQIIFIEVKTANGKLSEDQIKRHEELRANGAIVLVPFSFDQFFYDFAAIRAEIESARGETVHLWE